MTDDGGVYSISRMCNLLEADWVSKVLQYFKDSHMSSKMINTFSLQSF